MLKKKSKYSKEIKRAKHFPAILIKLCEANKKKLTEEYKSHDQPTNRRARDSAME